MATGTRGLIGKEDISFHVPASGSGVQKFDRTNSTGNTTEITKLSADHIPIRDEAVAVLGGSATRSPFYGLDAGVGTNHYVEDALADIRKNIPHYRNVEHYGMVPNDNTNAAAENNTKVWNQIISDLGSGADGIFFPGGAWYFKDTAGSEILSGNGVANVKVVGVGAGSAILANAAATNDFPLMRWDDSYGLTMADLSLDRQGTGADTFRMASVGVQLSDVKLLNCAFASGSSNVLIDGAGTTSDIDFWISGCRFSNANAYNLNIDGCSQTYIKDNKFSGTGTGISHTGSGGANVMRDVQVLGNVLQTANMNILVQRSGVYNASNHRGVSIIDNKITQGSLVIINMNRVLLQLNKLYAGGIQVTFNTMTTAQGLQIIGNEVVGQTGAGISISGASTTIEGFEILGGSISNCTQNGIVVQTSGAPAKWGRIQGVAVINCSREDIGTDYSGIQFLPLDANGGVLESIVSDNVIRCTTVTAGGRKHKYGVEETATGVSNKNMIGPNFIQGYVTADVLVSGAASADVVAYYALIDAHVAGSFLARYDAGTAV